jgi:hypothetical protein
MCLCPNCWEDYLKKEEESQQGSNEPKEDALVERGRILPFRRAAALIPSRHPSDHLENPDVFHGRNPLLQ